MEDVVVKFDLPYYKAKSKALYTLNVHRNIHFRSANSFKKKYSKIIAEELSQYDKVDLKLISLEYIIHFRPTAAGKPKKVDLSNVASMVDKVFCDVLQEEEWIADDDINCLRKVTYKANPFSDTEYVEVRIKKEIR